MKKNLIYAGMLLLGMMVATSCSNEESLEQVANNGKTIQAVIEKVVARTSVSDNYEVLWTENDQFDVWGETSKVGTLVLKSGEGTTSGSFGLVGTESFDVTDGMTAFYPSNSNNAKAYTFAESYTNQITNAPMVGTFTNGKFTFSLLTAMVRVVVTNVPQGNAVLTITSSDKTLTGEATLANDGTLGVPTGDGKTVTVTIANNTASTLTFDVPIPVQEYTNGLNATLKVADEEVFNKTTNSFTAVAGKLYKFDADASVVTNQTEFETALENSENIILGGDVTLGGTEPLVIESETTATIDLNGNSLDLNGQLIALGEGSTLNLVNNATSTVARSASAGVTITSTSDIIKASANSKINIGAGVNLETSGVNSCCIWIPNRANGVTVKSEGNLKCTSAGAAVISHNGNLISGSIEINGGSVIHKADVAIYIAGQAELTIGGDAVIEGTTGVEIRAGKLNVTGGTITATAEEFTATANNNGSTSVGAAVAVTQHSTNKSLEAIISGGIFKGIMALYEEDTCDEDVDDISLTVTGGTFNGSIFTENCKTAITGGEFADPSACYYLGTNANVSVNMEADYTGAGFKTQSGQTVALNIATGKTYTVTAPLVGSTGTQTLGFQFLQGSTVTIGGTGKITSSDAKMLINNYSNLTLSGVTLAPSVPNTMNGQTYYVLSNNCGEVNIEDGTTITAPTSSDATNCPTVYAFDVCKYASYPNVTVNVKGGTITGDVEYTGTEGDKQKLVISGGTIEGDLVIADNYKNASWKGVSITDGTQTGEGWDSYKPVDSAKLIGKWNCVSKGYDIKSDGTFDQYFNSGKDEPLRNEKWTLIGRILELTQVGDYNDDPEYRYIVSLTDTELKWDAVVIDENGNFEVENDIEVYTRVESFE